MNNTPPAVGSTPVTENVAFRSIVSKGGDWAMLAVGNVRSME